MDSVRQIENLLYRYGRLIDAGDFAGVAQLFDRGDHISSNGHAVRGSAAVLDYYDRRTRRFDDTGTPKTKHLTTNVTIEVDDAAGTAVSESVFVVFQAVAGVLPLQPIVAGRYEDRLARDEDGWYFTERRKYVELEGVLAEHLMSSPEPR